MLNNGRPESRRAGNEWLINVQELLLANIDQQGALTNQIGQRIHQWHIQADDGGCLITDAGWLTAFRLDPDVGPNLAHAESHPAKGPSFREVTLFQRLHLA